MKIKFLAVLIGLFVWAAPVSIAHAATSVAAPSPDEYYKGTVVHIIKEIKKPGTELYSQDVEVRLTTGPETDKLVPLNYGGSDAITAKQKVVVGDKVVIIRVLDATTNAPTYYLSDFDRLPWLYGFIIFFFVIACIFGGRRGITSLGGLVSTVAILLLYIVPRIIAGDSPVTTVLIGSAAIILFSMFFAHGINRQTAVAVVSTFGTIIFAIGFAALAIKLAHMFGTGSEEAMYIQLNNAGTLDVRGVLLGGMIIGTIGVLDDVTTAQTAAAAEIHDAKPGMHFTELFTRVMRVGREHIASLVNTLVLAYAGASFPLFLLLYSTRDAQPLWVVFNSQQLAEEITRTVVGSVTLVLAVPLSSALAAWYYTRHNKT